jgi:hypothetical protein
MAARRDSGRTRCRRPGLRACRCRGLEPRRPGGLAPEGRPPAITGPWTATWPPAGLIHQRSDGHGSRSRRSSMVDARSFPAGTPRSLPSRPNHMGRRGPTPALPSGGCRSRDQASLLAGTPESDHAGEGGRASLQPSSRGHATEPVYRFRRNSPIIGRCWPPGLAPAAGSVSMGLHKFWSLSASDRRVLFEAALLVAVARLGLGVLPHRRVSRLLTWLGERGMASHCPDCPSPDRIAWAVTRVSRHVPGTTCLIEALAARALFERHGHPGRLCIGVASRGPGTVDGHAWVESCGRVVVGGGAVSRYTLLTALDSPVADHGGKI